MFSRNTWRNPILEIKREGYLASEKEFQDDLKSSYKGTILKTKHIHTNLLFTTHEGFKICKGICKQVTSVEPSPTNNSWKDFAAKLGYQDVDIKCLEHLKGNIYDPTEVALMYYAATNKEASVGDILEVLLDLGFLPAVHQAHIHIEDFIAEAERTYKSVNQPQTEEKDNNLKEILKDKNFNPSVPAIFNEYTCKQEIAEEVNFNSVRNIEVLQCSGRTEFKKQQTKKYCKYVMLTFAADGFKMAQKVASVLRGKTSKKGHPIGVLMLCENDNIVSGNPGKVIQNLISKMDFVIPILTDGYFTAMEQANLQARLVDERFVQLIHDMLVSQYIHNHCINVSVRPVVSCADIDSVLRKPQFVHNTIFHAWRTEDQLSDLANCIVKNRRNKSS